MTSPLILDGKALAQQIESELAARVQRLKANHAGRTAVLATILVGADPSSVTYVKMKANACRRAGMETTSVRLDEQTTTQQLLEHIDALNRNPEVHGILLQHPVPRHIHERRCFDAISIDKDVDGVTCHGFGRMAMGEAAYGAATGAGIMKLLAHYQLTLSGKHAVVVGRSPILGKPMALMLLNADATVTICHSKTVELPRLVGQADVVIGALGKPEFVKGAWIKPGAVVIDAGYHPGGVGDVELSVAMRRCSAYTPVPGGVGPMTIAMLLSHTVAAAEQFLAR